MRFITTFSVRRTDLDQQNHFVYMDLYDKPFDYYVPAVSKTDWLRASLRMDLLVFVYSPTKTGYLGQVNFCHLNALKNARSKEKLY